MSTEWDARIDRFWEGFDGLSRDRAFDGMRVLVDERPADDPDAQYEWASLHDALDLESAAIPLYRAALDHGLSGGRRAQAIIQLASSLRNVGEPEAAVELLAELGADEENGEAARAFLALALRDAGHPDAALRVALLALAPTLPRYRRAVERYAEALTAQEASSGGSGD